MKRNIVLSLMVLLGYLCSTAQDFARGADISWVTEMEADGRKFYTAEGVESDLFALMKQIGMNGFSRNLVGISINFSKSEEEELFINNASQRSSECLNLCIERFCSCV